jgi:hypothetical protein
VSKVAVVRTIELRGPFSDAEISELIAWVRRCDNIEPRPLSIAIVAEEATMEQMERVVREGLPERADRVTAIRSIPHERVK